jgi:hypothetical protein
MAFRSVRLREIGGFDPRFRVAGDDVDVCWRLQARGCSLGFSPTAVVWHHRRRSIYAYWRQQKGYAKAEALLAEKWPEKYNGLGHVSWAGRLYGRGLSHAVFGPRWRVYHGRWGSAPFQSIYQPGLGTLDELPQTPEWYLISAALAILSVMSLWWAPFYIFMPVFVAVTLPLFAQAFSGAAHRSTVSYWGQRWSLLSDYGLLSGYRWRGFGAYGPFGLTPWRRRGVLNLISRPRLFTFWAKCIPLKSGCSTLPGFFRKRRCRFARW